MYPPAVPSTVKSSSRARSSFFMSDAAGTAAAGAMGGATVTGGASPCPNAMPANTSWCPGTIGVAAGAMSIVHATSTFLGLKHVVSLQLENGSAPAR